MARDGDWFDPTYDLSPRGATTLAKNTDAILEVTGKDATAYFKDGQVIRITGATTVICEVAGDSALLAGDTLISISPTFLGAAVVVPTAPTKVEYLSNRQLRESALYEVGAGGGLDADTLDGLHSADLAARNYAINGAMDVWNEGTSSLSCAAGSDTFTAEMFYVNPAGAAVSVDRVTSGLPTITEASQYGHKITGATSVNAVLFGTRIEASRIPDLTGIITVAVKIRNETGANLTPELLINTADAADDFSAVTNRLDNGGTWTSDNTPITDTSSVVLYHTVDISGYTNLANGLEIQVEFPSGSLDGSGKDVTIAEFQITLSSSRPPFVREGFAETLRETQRYFAKTFELDTAPVQNVGDFAGCIIGSTGGGADVIGEWVFPVEMFKDPTVTTYNPNASNALWRRSSDASDSTDANVLKGTSETATPTTAGSKRGVVLTGNANGGARMVIHASANARLT